MFKLNLSFAKKLIREGVKAHPLITAENTSLAALAALAHRLQRHTVCIIQNGRQWAPKWPMGSGKVSSSRFLGVLSNFRQISFLIRALLLWEKVATEKKKREKKKKRRMKIVATTSLPAVDRPNADRWNVARLCQNEVDYGHSYAQNWLLWGGPYIIVTINMA